MDQRQRNSKLIGDELELEPTKTLQESIRMLDLYHRQLQQAPTAASHTTKLSTKRELAPLSPTSPRELSMLATLIWMGEWETVVQRLATRPQEARQKIQLPAFPNSNVIIRAFPFHLACARRPLPPTAVMKELIAAYPEACKQPTGSPLCLLPMHLVADLSNIGYNGDRKDTISHREHSSLPTKVPQSDNHAEIVTLLLQHFPESVLLPETTNEMLPLHVAAATFKVDNCSDLDETSVPVQVMELLVDAGPPQVATKLKDRNGLSPMDWALRNAQYSCPRCKNCSDNIKDSTLSTYLYQRVPLYTCTCPEQRSGNKHPMLQSVIRSHLMTIQPAVREAEHGFMTPAVPTIKKENRSSLQQELRIQRIASQRIERPIQMRTISQPVKTAPTPNLFRRQARDDTFWIRDRRDINPASSTTNTMEARNSPKPLTRAKSFKEERQPVASSFVPSVLEESGSSHDLTKAAAPISSSFSDKLYKKALESRSIRAKFRHQEEKETDADNAQELDSAPTRTLLYMERDIRARRMEAEKQAHDNRNAVLCLKLRLSDLAHPTRSSGSSGSAGRVGSFSSNINPNPCFEIFVAHRGGMSKGYYKSYPMYNVIEGTWEEAFVDMGLTRHQLDCGIDGASHVEIGIRVMHCPNKGSDMKLIGSSQISLETLERNDRDTRSDNNKYPVLQGYQVKGWLQVLSFRIQ
jgi:hypothetical protein